MDKLTTGIIFTLKDSLNLFINNKEAIIDFLSTYTGTPKKYYTNEQIKLILRQCFTDYLKTCANPSYEVWNFFDVKRQHENFRDVFPREAEKQWLKEGGLDDDSIAIITCLMMVRVRDDNGNLINGFKVDDLNKLKLKPKEIKTD